MLYVPFTCIYIADLTLCHTDIDFVKIVQERLIYNEPLWRNHIAYNQDSWAGSVNQSTL